MSIDEQSTTFYEFDNLITVAIHAINGRGMHDSEPLTNQDKKDIKALLSECRGLSNKVSRCINTKINRSELSSLLRRYQVNKPFNISPMLYNFIDSNLHIYELTEGTYDFTALPLTFAWREIDERGLTDYADMIAEAKERVGAQYIELIPENSSIILKKENMLLDAGSSYRGYAIKYMAEHLIENGVTSGYINMGGSLHMIGRKTNGQPWTTTLINNFTKGETIGVIELEDKSLASATLDERGYTKGTRVYRHLIDPETGKKRDKGLFSVTCISDSSWIADISTTVLFLIGLERGREFMKTLSEEMNVETALAAIDDHGRVYISPSLEFIPAGSE